MIGREYEADTTNKYRYSFNGKETDSESDLQDYGMRIYSGDLGRFLSVDPLTNDYPFYSPYQFAGNTTIAAIDLDGGEPKFVYYNKKDCYHSYFDEATGKETLIGDMDGMSFDENQRLEAFTTKVGKTFYWNSESKDYENGHEFNSTPTIRNIKSEDIKCSEPNWLERNFPEGGLEGHESSEHNMPWEQGKSVMIATAGVVLTGGVMALEGASFLGAISILNSIEDLGVNVNGQSLSVQLLPNSQNEVLAVKTAISAISIASAKPKIGTCSSLVDILQTASVGLDLKSVTENIEKIKDNTQKNDSIELKGKPLNNLTKW